MQILCRLGLISWFLVPAGICASTVPWSEKKYELFSQGQSLPLVLKDFSANYLISAIVSDKIDGVVNGRFPAQSPQQFLEHLAKIYDFFWYYDGAALYFYSNTEITSQFITLSHLAADELKQSLRQLGIWDERYHWRQLPGDGVLHVSGPPRMVELVAEMASMLEQDLSRKREGQRVIRVFPLKYAMADTRSVDYRGSKITIPGIAETLQSIVAGKTSATVVEARQSAGLTSLRGKGAQTNNATKQTVTPDAAKAEQNAMATAGAFAAAGQAVSIKADARLNAVIVYDTLARMPMYEALIKELDKKLGQVEINVSIVSLTTQSLKEIGFSWRLQSRKQGSIGFGALTATNSAPASNGMAFVLGENATFSSILRRETDYLLARIDALAKKGNAQILSRPSIITSDNSQAILDNSSTFHVRVSGHQDVELFPVTVGSVLKVTPHIVTEQESMKIRLDVEIEDGQQTNKFVDGIPIIHKSSISTQAVVGENESLLLGGYYTDSVSTSNTHVPLLHRIPLLGHLFKKNHNEVKNNVRLFLISPQIISSADSGNELALMTNGDASGKKMLTPGLNIPFKDKEQAIMLQEMLDDAGIVALLKKTDHHNEAYSLSLGDHLECSDLSDIVSQLPAGSVHRDSLNRHCHRTATQTPVPFNE